MMMRYTLRAISYELRHREAIMNPPRLRFHLSLLAVAATTYLSGCATVPDKTAQKPVQTAGAEDKVIPPFKGGGYYKDDGPGRNPPANLDQVPDAVPKEEPLHPYANNAYKVMGKRYTPIPPDKEYKAKGLASWYGRKFHGRSTSSGEPYDMYGMTAAHATLPIPSYARVTNLNNGQSVLVRVNDRGPFHEGRIIDLSYTAAYKLDVLKQVTPVEVELVSADDVAPDSFIARAETPDVDVPEPAAPVREATPVAVKEPAAAKEVVAGTASFLQLGAFAKKESAEALLERAKTKLSKDFPGVMRLEIGNLHKIQAGPFMNPEAAAQASELIRQELGIQPIKVAAVVPPAVPAAPVGGLYLQLAALSNPTAAEALADKVRGHFGSELPGVSQVNVDKLVKVQAGPFADAAAAEKVALAYLKEFGVKPYKVQR
jgi:rare lipoprotein A